jgi:hypothetical protein
LSGGSHGSRWRSDRSVIEGGSTVRSGDRRARSNDHRALDYRRRDELRARSGCPERRSAPQKSWDESGSRTHPPAESSFEVIETEADCGFEAPRRCEETGQEQDKSANQADRDTETHRDEEGWHQEGNGQGSEARERQRQHSSSRSDHQGSWCSDSEREGREEGYEEEGDEEIRREEVGKESREEPLRSGVPRTLDGDPPG